MNRVETLTWDQAGPVPLAPGRPVIGNLAAVLSDPFGLADTAANELGSVFRIRIAGRDVVVVWAPEDMHRVLVDTGKVFGRAKATPMERAIGSSILTEDGDAWRRLRAIAQPAFRRKSLKSLEDELDGPVGAMLDRLARAARMGDLVDLNFEISTCFFRFTVDAIFGLGDADTPAEFTRAVQAMLDRVATAWIRPINPPAWMPTRGNRELQHWQRVFQTTVDGLIADRRRDGTEGRQDLLSLLIAANASPEEGFQPLSDEELRREVGAYLIAAYETTATTLTWTLALLAKQPMLWLQLQQLLDAGDEDDPLFEAVVNESMRLYPAAFALPREVMQDTVLAGCRLPAGSQLLVTPWLTHRDPRHWRRPWDFVPQRFLEPDPRRHPNAFLPFGLGPHSCVGRRLAMPMLISTLQAVLRRFELSIPGPLPEPLPRVTLALASPCLTRVYAR